MDLTDSAFSLFWPFHTSTPKGGVVFVSGVDGGLIEPGDGIYHSIAEELSHQGITSIFVRYRNPGDLEDSKIDALQGAKHLRMIGVKRMALVGWSFGGAVIAHAATQTPEAVTLIGFAPQAKDTDPIDDFTNRSLLLFHSRDDENIPFEASQQIMDSAPEHLKKRLVELSGYDHLLTGAGEEIRPIALEWLKSELNL